MTEETQGPSRKKWLWGSWKRLCVDLGILATLLIAIIVAWAYLPDIACHGIKKEWSREYSTDVLEWLGPRAAGAIWKHHKNFDEEQWTDLLDIITGNIKTHHDAILFVASLDDVNIRGFHRQTPLHYAVRNDSLVLVRRLIRNGAEVNARDDGGFMIVWDQGGLFGGPATPFDYRTGSNKELINFLRKHGARTCAELWLTEKYLSRPLDLYWEDNNRDGKIDERDCDEYWTRDLLSRIAPESRPTARPVKDLNGDGKIDDKEFYYPWKIDVPLRHNDGTSYQYDPETKIWTRAKATSQPTRKTP